MPFLMPPAGRSLVAVATVAVCAACPPVDAPSPTEEEPPGFRLGEVVSCDAPREGFARFTEEGFARGFTRAQTPSTEIAPELDTLFGGSFSVEDLDGDGDLDVASWQVTGWPRVWQNDGAGRFTEIQQGWATAGYAAMVTGQGAVDLNDDGLPDIVTAGPGRLRVSWNQGALEFNSSVSLYETPEGEPGGLYSTMSWGDLDGDGDLDVLLPALLDIGTIQSDPDEGERDSQRGGFDLLFINDGGELRWDQDLSPEGTAGGTFVSTFTDRDSDGDLDIFVASEGGHQGAPLSAFYRNDGVVDGGLAVTNDAPSIGADLPMSGMGIATWDLNSDGLFDYCLTDTGPIVCMVSSPNGVYVESGTALNLVPAGTEDVMFWSLDLTDLDNDGVVDAVTAGGPPWVGAPPPDQADQHPDAIWQGVFENGALRFEDRSDVVGFSDPTNHYGAVSADLDADGFLDVLVTGNDTVPVLWMNTCGDAGWLEVELDGPPQNRQGWGAKLEVIVDGRSEIQELQNVRGLAQGPSRFHVGTGPVDTVDLLRVTWPDGTVSETEDVGVNRVVTACWGD